MSAGRDSGNTAAGTATDSGDGNLLLGSLPDTAGRTGAIILLALAAVDAAAALALAGGRVLSG